MPSPNDDIDPSLFRDDIFTDLKDLRKFKYIIVANCLSVSARYGCIPRLSARKLDHCHQFYVADRRRALDHGSDVRRMTELDHLKDASFFTFWFRWSSPIGEIAFLTPLNERGSWPEGIAPSDAARDLFSLYADELCGFLIGFQIATYFELVVFGRTAPLDALRIDQTPEGQAVLDNLKEVCSMLKHKNMSPHAIYLMFKFLFAGAEGWRR